MRETSLALVLGFVTLAVAVVFLAVALGGADLCLWCRAP